MNCTPEPSLQPQESPLPPLRCCLCMQEVAEVLELPYGTVCRSCLDGQTMDELSALLCAPILSNENEPRRYI